MSKGIIKSAQNNQDLKNAGAFKGFRLALSFIYLNWSPLRFTGCLFEATVLLSLVAELVGAPTGPFSTSITISSVLMLL